MTSERNDDSDFDDEDDEDDNAAETTANNLHNGRRQTKKLPRTKNTNTAFILRTGCPYDHEYHETNVQRINNGVYQEFRLIEDGVYLRVRGEYSLINQIKCWSCVDVDDNGLDTESEYIVYVMVSINHRIQVNFRYDSFRDSLARQWGTFVQATFPKTFRGRMETDIALYFSYLRDRHVKERDLIQKRLAACCTPTAAHSPSSSSSSSRSASPSLPSTAPAAPSVKARRARIQRAITCRRNARALPQATAHEKPADAPYSPSIFGASSSSDSEC